MIASSLLLLPGRWNGRSFSTKSLQAVVGLEIHMQILSKSKLFSPASTKFAEATNANVSLFDAAIPGTLPSLNRRCVEAAVQAAIAFKCGQINNLCRFDRKHYFYADMPAGYQITQQFKPIAREGLLEYFVTSQNKKEAIPNVCRLHQLQIEQDSGRSIHDARNACSYICLNRAGIGLLEFVFEPDLKSGTEAASLVNEFLAIVKALGISSGLMSEGAVRVDANVSVHEEGTPLGVRTEIKNLNSISSVRKGIDFEIKRQKKLVEGGEVVRNVTMTFDVDTDSTVMLRDKEVLQDYRFFPEPNIPLVDLEASGISVDEMRKTLPALPPAIRQNLMEEHGIPFWKTVIMFQEPHICEYFYEAIETLNQAGKQKVCDTLITVYIGHLAKHSITMKEVVVEPAQLRELILLTQRREITLVKYRPVLYEMLETGESAEDVVNRNNWWRIDNDDYLTALVDEAIHLHPKAIARYRRGKKDALTPLYGHIINETNDRIDRPDITARLRERLDCPEGDRSESERMLSDRRIE